MMQSERGGVKKSKRRDREYPDYQPTGDVGSSIPTFLKCLKLSLLPD